MSCIEPDLSAAVNALRNGHLVIVPTDTVYGIAADPRIRGAEDRLCEAKGRDRDKPIPLLAAGISEVEKYGAILGQLERKLAEKFWPGPLTVVLAVCGRTSAAAVRSLRVAPARHFEGFRVPDSDVTLALLREVGGVLRVTSANRSGEPPALTAQAAICSVGRFASAVLDSGAAPGGMPSSVVKVESRKVRILREGAIPARSLMVEDR